MPNIPTERIQTVWVVIIALFAITMGGLGLIIAVARVKKIVGSNGNQAAFEKINATIERVAQKNDDQHVEITESLGEVRDSVREIRIKVDKIEGNEDDIFNMLRDYNREIGEIKGEMERK